MKNEKFTINYVPETVDAGEKRSELPLHLTIVPPVHKSYSPDYHFDYITEKFDPIEIETIGLDTFDNTKVRLTTKPKELMELRKQMVNHAIGMIGVQQWSGRQFNPHFSLSDENDLNAGTKLSIDQLAVWTKRANGLWRVGHLIKLGESALIPIESIRKQHSIKKAKETDLKEILDLQKNAYISEAELYNDYSIEPLRQAIEEIKDEYSNGIILKAVNENFEIIGSVRAHKVDDTVFVKKLIVHPDYQNQGIGTDLLKAIEEQFCETDSEIKFQLFTGHKSEKNLHLYKKLGYKECGREKVSDNLEFVHLIKNS